MSAAVQPMQEAAIRQYAKQLRLATRGGQFARLAEQAVKEKQSHLSCLEALLEGEVEERGRKAMARRIQEARFPPVKTLEEFDFQCASHIPAALVRNLSEGGYLERKEPIIFLGETGTGKTHLATGLAVAAGRQRKRVRFTTAAELLFQVIAGRAERAAVIVTTNLPFSEWTTKFPNTRLCKAMLDRWTDQAHITETGNESCRFRRTLEKKPGQGAKA